MAVSAYRPNSEGDFARMLEEGLDLNTQCLMCGCGFDKQSVHTSAGWRETQITG